MRISYDTMVRQFEKVLLARGLSPSQANLSATMVAQTSLEGVYTHGANRFPFMIKNIDTQVVDIHSQAVPVGRFGSLERWDGKRGLGNLNAHSCMARAIELGKESTIGCVALANTTHWMRPGTYGLMAAEQDCIGILWTNTLPLMAPWGGKETKLGNNPLVMAIPCKEGPVLVDAAMSLFSYGKLESYVREEKPLPVEGGYDTEGKLTKDAGEILKSQLPLPIGFWKGSSLALALDLMASVLSGGRTTRSIGTLPKENEVSQVFIAISLANLPDRAKIEEEISLSLADIKQSTPLDGAVPVRFPGENRLKIREENLRLGIPVDERVWEEILAL